MDMRSLAVAPPSAARPLAAARGERRQAILLAAEKLFAEHGYRAVTIRRIADEAGVPLALVGYYFGAKHELFHAIFEHWRHTIDERLARLRQARSPAADGDALRRIVGAFVEPVLQMRASAEGESYALLVARELAYRTPEASRVLADFFDPMAHAFIDALHRACPGSTRAQAAWAYQFALGALIHHISDHRVQALSRGRNRPNDARAGALLINFVSAGIAAVLRTEASTTPPNNPTRRRP
jgi:AcrR family transcriptional regulator